MDGAWYEFNDINVFKKHEHGVMIVLIVYFKKRKNNNYLYKII